jgi:hypothetical protein
LRAAKVAAAAVTAAPRLQLLCLWLPLFLLLPIHCHRLRCATATTAGRQPGHQQLLQKAVSNHGAQLLHQRRLLLLGHLPLQPAQHLLQAAAGREAGTGASRQEV